MHLVPDCQATVELEVAIVWHEDVTLLEYAHTLHYLARSGYDTPSGIAATPKRRIKGNSDAKQTSANAKQYLRTAPRPHTIGATEA